MYALIYVRYLHSYVLLFLCLLKSFADNFYLQCSHCYSSFVFLLLHPAFVMFRSLVPARDDVSQALCCSVGVYLFLDRRT